MAFKIRHILLENAAIDEASFNHLLANVVDEVSQNKSPVVVRRINMDHCVSANVNDSCVTKQTVGASADKEVDSLQTNRRCRRRAVASTRAMADRR